EEETLGRGGDHGRRRARGRGGTHRRGGGHDVVAGRNAAPAVTSDTGPVSARSRRTAAAPKPTVRTLHSRRFPPREAIRKRHRRLAGTSMASEKGGSRAQTIPSGTTAASPTATSRSASSHPRCRSRLDNRAAPASTASDRKISATYF